MRRPLLNSALPWQLLVPIAARCVVPPGPGSSTPPEAEAYGPGAQLAAAAPVPERALRALTRVSDGNPYPRPAP